MDVRLGVLFLLWSLGLEKYGLPCNFYIPPSSESASALLKQHICKDQSEHGPLPHVQAPPCLIGKMNLMIPSMSISWQASKGLLPADEGAQRP